MSYFSQIDSLVDQRSVLYKEKQAGFYPSWLYVLCSTIVQYPIIILEVIIFCSIMYLMATLTRSDNGIHYLYFIIIIFLLCCTMNSFFRAVIYFTSNKNEAHAALSIILFFMLIFGGFFLTKSDIKKAFIWIYYITPFNYAMKSLAINEFKSGEYNEPYGDTGLTRGEVYLNTYDFPTDFNWIIYAIVILIGEHLIFILIQMIAVTVVPFDPFPHVFIFNHLYYYY